MVERMGALLLVALIALAIGLIAVIVLIVTGISSLRGAQIPHDEAEYQAALHRGRVVAGIGVSATTLVVLAVVAILVICALIAIQILVGMGEMN
jgi:hypothetical protein